MRTSTFLSATAIMAAVTAVVAGAAGSSGSSSSPVSQAGNTMQSLQLRKKFGCYNVESPDIDDYVQCDGCTCDDNDGENCWGDCMDDWGKSGCCKACCWKCAHGHDGNDVC